MKKQLLIAAVAATMASAAMAEISITGDAKYEYKNVDVSVGSSAASENTANTEVNIKIVGKSGNTTVVLNNEFNSSDSAATASGMDTEDMYLTTKIGDFNVKAGNYTTGTSAILGEIDNGARSMGKVTVDTTVAGVNIYAGDTTGETVVRGAAELTGNMFYGVKADVAGFTLQAKHNSPTTSSFGIAGDVAGVGIRFETKDVDGASNDVDFGSLTYSTNGVDLGYAWIDAEADALITEDDSSIFAVSNNFAHDGAAAAALGDSNTQLSMATTIAGNGVSLKTGSIGFVTAVDIDYTQVEATRALASGADLTVTYTQIEQSAVEVDTLEVDLSVKF